MKTIKLFLFTILSSFFLAKSTHAETVVEIIVSSEAHDTLEAAVIAAGLADDLSAEGPFTVFAPTDDAFKALPEGTLETLLADPEGDLADILLYHVAGTKAMSGDLGDGQMVTTLLGKNVEVSIDGGKVYINGAEVTIADLEADNGVVHVIDAVLLPPTKTVVDVIIESDVHTTLETAVVAAGLVDDLSVDGNFTVFAPTDDAFNALPSGTLDALLADPEGELVQILLYNVAGVKALSGDLNNGQLVATLQSQNVEVGIDAGKVFINGAEVTIADIETDNGVVHVINAVLLPESDPTNIYNIEAAGNMNVYPNPTNNVIHINFSDNENPGKLQMFNVTGMEVYSTGLFNNNLELNVSEYKSGIYFIRVSAGETLFNSRIVIE